MPKRVVFNEYKKEKYDKDSVELFFSNDAGEELTIVLPPFTFFPQEWQDELKTGDPFKQADAISGGRAQELADKFGCTPIAFLELAFDSFGFDLETLGKLAASSNFAETMEQS